MKVRNLLTILAVAVASAMPLNMNSQAETGENVCKTYFKTPYIVTGKPFRALLTGDEVAEFHTTLFSGTTYRIAAATASSEQNNAIVFSVYDVDHNLLFTNKDYSNAPYWDFCVEGYLDCIVEARLDEAVSSSGYAIVMTGFKLSEEDSE